MRLAKIESGEKVFASAVFGTGQVGAWTHNRDRAQVLTKDEMIRVARFYANHRLRPFLHIDNPQAAAA